MYWPYGYIAAMVCFLIESAALWDMGMMHLNSVAWVLHGLPTTTGITIIGAMLDNARKQGYHFLLLHSSQP
jgi:hypothetical protein